MWFACALLAAMLWGLNYSISEKLLFSISPFTLLALEMLAGTIVFFALAYFANLKTDIALISSQPKLFALVIIEIIAVLAASFFIVYSIQLKDGTTVGIIELIYPLFTIFFTWILFQTHHLSIPVVVGGLFIIIGVCIISLA